MSTVDVTLSGPLLDGTAHQIVDRMIDDVRWDVGQAALSEVHQRLDASIRNPTPYYETQVTVERLQGDVVVHDRGIVYGPWLEGVGSRNETTRFKGYASFRRAKQATEQRVDQITSGVVGRYIGRLGGG